MKITINIPDKALTPKKYSVEQNAEDFCNGIYEFSVSSNQWIETFVYLSEHVGELDFDTEKIHLLWTVNGGHLRRKIKNDRLIADVLANYLPKYSGPPLILYRGECRFLYEDNQLGFCWTPCIEVAEMFARGLNAIESGGVLLKAEVPSEAIFTKPNAHSTKQMREFEYTCNPALLKKVEVIKWFPKSK